MQEITSNRLAYYAVRDIIISQAQRSVYKRLQQGLIWFFIVCCIDQ